MMNLVSRLLRRGTPTIAEVRPADAPAIAAVHAASFQRGWGEDEIQRLLLERNIVAQRITAGGKLVGFILSRIAAGGAGNLFFAAARGWRCRGLAPRLLALLLRPPPRRGLRLGFFGVRRGKH